EKAEEAKLKSRYPSLQNAGSSQLLQKRLSKGTKYFDSGDYNMAKAKTGGSGGKMIPGSKPPLLLETGEAIPTPESVPHKKVGPQQSKLAGAS
ncbi:hypothetical protein HELRODRAFT_83561, partial [Helobdella robusta]|uniref:Alpha-endosulfine n=1 Tax=Helobdella robusta TaxID=6412 RepID=T1G572_HELRO